MNTSAYKIIIPETKKELEDYYRLRYEILRKPWNQPEKSTRDDSEDRSVHVLMIDENNQAIACGRLQLNSKTEGQIRSMAVETSKQGQGLGGKILDFIEMKAKELDLKMLILDSRKPAEGFYKKHGFNTEGESYLLFGVIPHVRMSKKI